MWRRTQKRYYDHFLQFGLRGRCPPALPLMPDTSVPPCMTLVPFKLLSPCWSPEGLSLSKSKCGTRPFKRRGLRIPQLLPPTKPLLDFAARSYGDLPSWHWNPWLVGLLWGWDPSFLRYPFTLSTTCVFGTTQFQVSTSPPLHPSYPSR